MKLNQELLEKFKNSSSKLLSVTKYFENKETLDVLKKMEEKYSDIFEGLGENRLVSLREKNLDREKTHFIGNLQTKELKHIVDLCSTLHSLDSIKKAKKLNDLCEVKNIWIKVFIQINLDENKPGGISPDDLGKFLITLDEFENLGVVGISGMGKLEFTREEKEKEFDLLISLRNKYLQKGLISAGTSADYEIALDKGIDIIRVGKKLFNI